MSRPVSSIMQTNVVPVDMDDTIDRVEEKFDANAISSAPVVAGNGAVVGIITSHDLLAFHAAGKDPTAVRAWEICSYKPIEVAPDRPLEEVADLMLTDRVHHVVVAEKGDMKGIVSSLDFVKLFLQQGKA